MQESELERERAVVSELYQRLDALRADTAERLDRVRRESVGGNHQARSERDAFAQLYEDQLAQLREVDERLVFGRLLLDEPVDGTDHRYIGRIGLRDEDQRSLLLDWRAQQAGAFYQATANEPMGVRARRHLTMSGREVVRDRRRGLRRGAARRRAVRGGRAGRGRAAGRAHGAAHRPDARHRRDHPGRAGPHHPLRAARRARRAGRTRDRQDRGRAAPRRLPAVREPGAAARIRRARRRPVDRLPAVHRGGAAVARRDRRRACRRWASSSRASRRRPRMRRRRRG